MKTSILSVSVFLALLIVTPMHAQTISGKLSKAKVSVHSQLSISSPKNNARVSSPLTIIGTATKNTEISVNVKATFTDGNQDLGTFVAMANSSGKWQSTPINLWAPEDAKNLRYEITASTTTKKGSVQKPISKKIIVSPNQNIQMISRVEMTEKKMKALNPQVTISPKVVKHSPIAPLTAEQINSINKNTETRITSPVVNSNYTKIPIVFKGTAKRNSEVKVEILTSYRENGKFNSNRITLNPTSDNSGTWGGIKIFSIQVDEADDKVTHEITAVRIENGKEIGNKATRTIYSQPTTKTLWKPIVEKNIKLKITLFEIQCAVSKDDDKVDDYGITQHVKYTANGKVKKPFSRDIKKFPNHTNCKPGDEKNYWSGATSLICGNKDRQIHVTESKVTEKRSPNINNSIVFEITPSEAKDKNAEFTIDTWIKEYSNTTFSDIFGNEDYDNVLNKDPRKMRVAIHDVLAILNGEKQLNATNKYFDGDVSQSLRFDNFDDASLPLRKVDYSSKTILEGPIRGRMRNRYNNRKAFVWMRFEIIE